MAPITTWQRRSTSSVKLVGMGDPVITGKRALRAVGRLKSVAAFVPSKRAQRRPLILPRPARNDPSIDFTSGGTELCRLGSAQGRITMPDHVYRIIEVAGSSEKSIEDAIQNAVSRASRTLRGVSWFEVLQTRGQVEATKLQYQVVLKVGFTLEEPS